MKASLLAAKALERFRIPDSLEEARSIQESISKKLSLVSLDVSCTKSAVALDVSYDRSQKMASSCAVVFDLRTLETLDILVAKSEVVFPYIPGYLAFLEIPPILKVLKKVDLEVDIFICEGHGIAHPRGAGLASHLGFLLSKPVLGIAKNLLYGIEEKSGFLKSGMKIAYVLHPLTGERIAASVRNQKRNWKPVYVSPGNAIDLESSLEVALKMMDGNRLPKPLRLAHRHSRFSC